MTFAIRNSIAIAAMAVLLGACASKGSPTAQYDFGPLPDAGTPANASASTPASAIIVADISGPAALDSERMNYRLLYSDARQSRPYAYNQWTSTPLQLLTQRMKARIAQSGVRVLSTLVDQKTFSRSAPSPSAARAALLAYAAADRVCGAGAPFCPGWQAAAGPVAAGLPEPVAAEHAALLDRLRRHGQRGRLHAARRC
jgi:hypothetical protein